MKTSVRYLCVLSIIALLAAPAMVSRACEPITAELLAEMIAGGNNLFGWSMLDTVTADAEVEENVVFSPASIHIALYMTSVGASGDTLTQMDDVLEITSVRNTGTTVSEGYDYLLNEVRPGEDDEYQLTIANALWGQTDYPWQPTFETELKDNFDAAIQDTDFADAEITSDAINSWVAQNTNNLITDIVSEESITADMRLMLVNAIHFKADWDSPFETQATTTKPFTISADETIDVEMMHQETDFKYVEMDGVQVVAMPYKGRDISMVLILPDAEHTLAEARKWVTDGNLCANVNSLARTYIAVSLPKFTMRTRLDLASTLGAMGMTDAFGDNADFSGMSPNAIEDGLHIFDVVHEAYITVDETGTEAAAATGIGMGVTSIPPTPIAFNADHPFVFVIRHNPTGEVLFAGQVVRPEYKDESEDDMEAETDDEEGFPHETTR
jgi:serpin B